MKDLKDLKDYSFLLGDWSPEAKRRMFWDGFWCAFRHPVMIYGFGFFTAGFIVRGWIGA